MRNLAVVLGTILVLGGLLVAAEGIKGKILIIDESEGLTESLKLEAMARILIQQGFSLAAIQGFPEEPVGGAPFDLVLVIPGGGRYIWLCVPPWSKARRADAEGLKGLKELVVGVFGGARELRTPAEDLWPLILSLRLAALGIFGEG